MNTVNQTANENVKPARIRRKTVVADTVETPVPAPAKKARRGRRALEGAELNVPALRTILARKPLSHYYKMKLAQSGLISFIAHKEPGSRGRPEMVPVITDKGRAYYEKNSDKVPGYLVADAA